MVDVRTDVPLTPGSTITVAAKGTGPNARLVIYSDDPRRAAPAGAGQAAPSLAGKQPIGEAIIIGRAARRASARPSRQRPNAGGRARCAIDRSGARAAASPQPDAGPRNVTPQQALGEAVRVAACAAERASRRCSPTSSRSCRCRRALCPRRCALPPSRFWRCACRSTENLTAADVKQAFVRSGVLFEPRLAAEGARSGSIATRRCRNDAQAPAAT